MRVPPIGLNLFVEVREKTRPGDEYRTYRSGEKFAQLVVRIPWWLAGLLRHVTPCAVTRDEAYERTRVA